jgi:hypothetical protein
VEVAEAAEEGRVGGRGTDEGGADEAGGETEVEEDLS